MDSERRATSSVEQAPGSVLTSHVTKRSLVAVSHAMERYVGVDLSSSSAPRLVLGMFQRRAYFDKERERYAELAASGCLCLVGFVGSTEDLPPGVLGVSLPPDHVLAEEWSLIALGGPVAAALVATDGHSLATYEDTLETGRLFRAHWTFVRDDVLADAARLISDLSSLLDVATMEAVTQAIRATSSVPASRDGHRWSEFTERLVASLDRAHQRTLRLRVELATARTASEHDSLTGLANRRYLDRYLGGPVDGAPVTVAAMMVDVDNLKMINDVHGHAAGDAAIVAVSQALCATTRPEDVVCRFGGDEFVVLLPGLTPEAALHVADRVVTGVRETQLAAPWSDIALSVSVGVAPGAAARVPVELLDQALYRVKRGGRDAALMADAELAGSPGQ